MSNNWTGIEDAESYANTNALSGLNGGSGWGGAWTIATGTGFTITNTQAAFGSLSICRITGSTVAAKYYRQISAAASAGVCFFSIRTSDVTASVGTQVTLGVGAGDPSSDISFRVGGLSGHLEYLSGGGAGWTDIQAVSNDTWYRIGAEWDTVNQVNKFRYNINGGAFSSWVAGGASIGSITAIALTNAGNGAAANSYFDGIHFSYGFSTPSDTSVSSDSVSTLLALFPNVSDTSVTSDSVTVKRGLYNTQKSTSTWSNLQKS